MKHSPFNAMIVVLDAATSALGMVTSALGVVISVLVQSSRGSGDIGAEFLATLAIAVLV